MAKQCGPIPITGCVQGLVFYKMEGKYYVRQKSSLTRKRVRHDPAFRQTMYHAGLLGKAAAIASAVYKQINPALKNLKLYRTITGAAINMLKQGKDESAVKHLLEQQYLPEKYSSNDTKQEKESRFAFAEPLLSEIFAVEYCLSETKPFCGCHDLPP